MSKLRKIWMIWKLRKAYKANYEALKEESELWDYVSVESILETTEWKKRDE